MTIGTQTWRLTTPELARWVRVKLGGSFVTVELDDDDIQSCVVDVTAAFNRFVPGLKSGVLYEPRPTRDGNRYIVNERALVQVIDVHFLRRTQFIEYMGIENPFYLDAVRRAFRGGSAGEYMQDLGYLEQAKKVFSSHPEWRAQWEPERDDPQRLVYALYVDIHAIGLAFTFYDICYWFHFAWEPSDDPIYGIGGIQPEYHDWFRNFVLARAKQVLGHKRSKFMGIPMPDGSIAPTDGATLVDEGLAAEEALRADAAHFQAPVPPMTE